MREIITLQLGHLSNYTATHFWNTQESYFTYDANETSLVDHNVHWRQGLGTDGSDTFLPRTVIYDLKGGFGSLKKINALYESEADHDATATGLWSGKSEIHKQIQVEPNEYQKSLESGTGSSTLSTANVRYWSDFSRVYYHPKSSIQLYDFELHSTVMPFEKFDMGKELFGSLDKDHDIVDRDWRPFVEECDRMDGIQIFASLDDAWGGFAASYIEALRDEYPKHPVLIWGLQSPTTQISRAGRFQRLTNAGQAIADIASHETTLIPVSLPAGQLPSSIRLDTASDWHISALFATAIETALLPTRLNHISGMQRPSLWDWSEILNSTGNRHLAAMTLSIGQDSGNGIDSINLLNVCPVKGDGLQHDYTFSEIDCVRGDEGTNLDAKSAQVPTEEEDTNRSSAKSYHTTLEFPIIDSFPSIYSDYTNKRAVPVHTKLSTNNSISHQMKSLKSLMMRATTLDEREALLNSLAEISDAYQEDWVSGSDSGDDE